MDATIGIFEYTKKMKELPKEYTTLLKEIQKDSPISSWLPSFLQKDTRHMFNFRVSLFSLNPSPPKASNSILYQFAKPQGKF